MITTAVSEPLSVFAIDLNGDNHPDVLSASFLDDKIAYYINDGVGNFSDSGQALGNATSEVVSLGDVDADGLDDLLFGAPGSDNSLGDVDAGRVSIVELRGNGLADRYAKLGAAMHGLESHHRQAHGEVECGGEVHGQLQDAPSGREQSPPPHPHREKNHRN